VPRVDPSPPESEASPELHSLPAPRNIRVEPRGTMTQWLWHCLLAAGLSLSALFLVAWVDGNPSLSTRSGQAFLISAIASVVTLVIREIRFPIGMFFSFESNEYVLRIRSRTWPIAYPDPFVDGWYNPGARRIELLNSTGDIISADVDDANDAAAWLHHFGVGAWYQTTRIRLGAVDFLNALAWVVGLPVAYVFAEALGAAMMLQSLMTLPLTLVIFIVNFILIRKLFGPAYLTVGIDGIIVQQRFRSQFVSFEDLVSISTAADKVTFALRSGRTVQAKARHLDPQRQSILQQRIQDTAAIRTQLAADPTAARALDRGERDGATWRQALRGIFEQDRGYRQAQLNSKQVTAILVDPTAPNDRRIGAALALAQTADPEVKGQIQWAAQTTANRKIRVALESIAQGALDHVSIDEAAMEEAAANTETVRKRQRG
jgi:hypothetical protein